MSKNAGKAVLDDRLSRAVDIIVGTNVLVGPFVRVEQSETELRVTVTRLPDASNVDEKADLLLERKSFEVFAADEGDVRVADEAERRCEVIKLRSGILKRKDVMPGFGLCGTSVDEGPSVELSAIRQVGKELAVFVREYLRGPFSGETTRFCEVTSL